MSCLVSVVRVGEDVKKAVWRAIDLVGDFRPRDGSEVVVKPNLYTAMKNADSGVTTDVRVVEAVIECLQSRTRGLDIAVVEADSDRPADEAFRRLGYEDMAEKLGVRLVNLSRDRCHRLVPRDARKIGMLEVPETLLEADYLVSVAKIKRHVHERFTGVWKNQYVLIPDKPVRIELHPFLKEVLYDLNTLFKPDLAILDGIVGLEGPDPIDGYPKPIGRIVCPKNPLAADVAACRLIGENPMKVPAIRYAVKHGWEEVMDIEVVGDGLEPRVELHFITETQYRLYRLGMWLKRIAYYTRNLGRLVAYGAFALRSFEPEELVGGKLMSISDVVGVARETVFRVEACERIAD